jgi:hypothetical protein
MRKDQIAFTINIVLLAILFVVLAVLTGWLFSIGGVRQPKPPAPPPAYLSGTATGQVDVTLSSDDEVLLRVDASVVTESDSVPRKPVLVTTNRVFSGGISGEMPMLCPHHGPEIRSQRDYPNPALHEAVASPALVTFYIWGGAEHTTEQKEQAQ